MREYTLTMPMPWLARAVIERIAQDKQARYLGDSQIPVRPASSFDLREKIVWSDQPASIFWQDNPPNGYSNFFCCFRRNNQLFIHSANEFDGVVEAIYSTRKPRYATYSSHGHDMHAMDPSGNVCIDGGRHYVRVLGTPGTYEVGKLRLHTMELLDSDGEVIGKCEPKFKGWK